MAKLSTLAPRLRSLDSVLGRKPANPEARRVEERGTTAERGYGAWWQRESKALREKYAACVYCWLEGRQGPVDLIDHLYPHGVRRGAKSQAQERLFRLKTYWLPSCHTCHRSFKAKVEAQGIEAIDALARRLGLEPLNDKQLREACFFALIREG